MTADAASLEERRLLQALRAGDEDAFAVLHERYDARLVALAMSHGCSHAVAQEVVQETWAAVVRNIHRFEGRAALKTWIFRILVNAANAQVKRERRLVAVPLPEEPEPAYANVVELQPAERLVWKETVGEVLRAINTLPPAQREVIMRRDVEGWTAEEVCRELGLTDGNQRVLLHRARAGVRTALASYLEPEERLAA